MDPKETLDLLKIWKEKPLDMDYSNIWKKAHELADAEDPDAKEFFIQGLDDPFWRWRDDCVSFLGFHYQLQEGTLMKIRSLLLNDPSSNVRISAASVLGRQSSLPDLALLSAIKSDYNQLVRESAFEAILTLAGVSNDIITQAIKRIKKGEIQPTISEVKRILDEENIDIFKSDIDI